MEEKSGVAERKVGRFSSDIKRGKTRGDEVKDDWGTLRRGMIVS